MTTPPIPRTLQYFFQRLRSLNPVSVLDIGCGRGDLLVMCQEMNIEAHGVDRGAHNVRHAHARGVNVEGGFAEKLSFSDGACDWAVLRNVLHHLPNVQAALQEALRSARTGVLIAEPWADVSVPSQQLAQEIDHWSKQVHQALGYYHRPGLALTEIIDSLPPTPFAKVTVEHFVELETVGCETVFDQMSEFTTQLPVDHLLRQREQALKRRAEKVEITAMGSIMVQLLIEYRT